MRVRQLGAIACALGVLAGPTATLAQTPAPAAPAQAAPASPEAEALVRRYLKAIDFERSMDALMAAILPPMMAQVAREHPDLTSEDRQMIIDVTREVMREKFTPQMIDRIVPIYAQAFTVPELKAMVDFYESPVGRSITAKAPALAPRVTAVTQQLMPTIQADVLREMLTKLCAKHSCSAAPPPKSSSS